MAYVKSLRDTAIRSLTGHTALIEARKPTFIPDAILQEAFAVGCIQCDKDGKYLVDEAQTEQTPVDEDDIPKLTPEEAQDKDKRLKVIKLAVAKIYQKNDRADFKADNTPKVAAVMRYTGFTVVALEVVEAMESLDSE